MSKASIETDIRDYGLDVYETHHHTYENCHNYTCRQRCKQDGWNDAIDEFAKRVTDKIVAKYCNTDLTGQYIGIQTCEWIEEIASDMKFKH